MIKEFKEKLKSKEYAQYIAVELVSDVALIIGGILMGYIFRAYIL